MPVSHYNEWGLNMHSIAPYILPETAPAHKAWYYLTHLHEYQIVIVVDAENRTLGILTKDDFVYFGFGFNNKYCLSAPVGIAHQVYDNATCGEICNRKFSFIEDTADPYEAGRRIFGDAGLKIQTLPVLKAGICVGLFGRWQAFYREYLLTHRLHCAVQMRLTPVTGEVLCQT
jgi:hypothetical protein